MKLKSLSLIALLGSSALSASAWAKEPYADYLQALRANDYGEMAVLYLERAKAGKLPEELTTTWELEMALSEVVWAAEAFNAEQANTRLDLATKHFQSFLKANPQHDSSSSAIEGLARMLSERGQFEIRQAKATKDTQRQQASYVAARKYFAEARTWQKKLVDATDKVVRDLTAKKKEKDADKAPKPGAGTAKKVILPPKRIVNRKPTEEENELRDAEEAWLDARMNFGLVDYYEAITYTDAADKTRKDLLNAASKKFDDIYQGYRSNLIGVYAHMWHGRCVDDLGNFKDALDIYEEVLAASSADVPELADLFAQVEMSRLLILRKKGENERFAKEAAEWLNTNQKMKNLPGFQGIYLELAKYQIGATKDLTGKAKEDAFRKILKALTDITKVQSEYRQEAFLLRRQYSGEVTTTGEDITITSFEEGVAVAADASSSGRWGEAIIAYTKTIEMADPKKDADKVRKIRYQLAVAQLMGGKPDECIKTAQAMVKEGTTAPFSPEAGAISVQAALAIYASPKEANKDAAIQQLTTLANDTIKSWPTRPEADDARIALGQVSSFTGKTVEALMAYESVNPQSERYPLALFYAGKTYWSKFLSDRRNPMADAKALGDVKAKAAKQLTDSVAGQEKQLKAGEQPPKQLLEAKTILGEMALDANQPVEALKYLDPLADTLVKVKPPQMDNVMMRQLLGAAKARLALKRLDDLEKTGEIVALMSTGNGTDAPFINAVLVEYTKQVDEVVKTAKTAINEAEKAENATEKTKNEEKRDVAYAKWTELINQLAPRQQLSLGQSMYLADSLLVLEQKDKARDVLMRIEQRANEPGFVPKEGGAGAMVSVRTKLAGLLRDEGKFDEALKTINNLITATKGQVVEPLVEKCRITEAKAEQNPATWGAAVNEWSALRNLMMKMRKKPKEFYDVVYGVGRCMVKKAEAEKTKPDAEMAEKLLKSTLALAPELNGPDMVVKYNDLIEDAIAVKTGKPKKVKVDPLAAGKGDAGAAGEAAAPAAAEKKPDAKPADAPKPAAGAAPAPAKPAAAPATGAKPAAAPAAGTKPATPAAKK